MTKEKKYIKREYYLNRIRPMYHDEQIKLIVGMRRCGKSIVLRQIIDELETSIPKDHIIYLNLELVEYSKLLDIDALNKYVEDRIVDNLKYYVFFDEIQLVDQFEKLLNSLRSENNISIFVTGSNGHLLSGELATLLSGRYVKYEIEPFTLKEAIEYIDDSKGKQDDIFNDYFKFGGLPHRFDIADTDSIISYLTDVYDSIVSRDIVARAKIRNVQLFNDVFRYTLENVGSLFSLKKILGFLGSIGRKASADTIYEYLNTATSGMLLHRAERYNISGKNILENIAKYYATDLGIMQIKLAKNKLNQGAIIENIVFNELRRRGYDVYIGYLQSAEIDFVAIKQGKIEYYQVSTYLDGNKDLQNREFNAYNYVKDNFPKYIISMDKIDFSKDGIIHKNIINWLLEEKE